MLFDPADPVFWVMIAFFGFVGSRFITRLPGMIAKALDARAEAIRNELDEARRLRDEAQALLADYQSKSREAENEAQAILEQAKRESEALASETRKNLTESVERRTKLAEEKIARAEAQAVSEVRASAVESAIAAAEKILKARATGPTANALVESSIRDLGRQAQLSCVRLACPRVRWLSRRPGRPGRSRRTARTRRDASLREC